MIEINWYSYWNAMYGVMIAMLLHAGNSLLSAWGTCSRNRTTLLISVILRSLPHLNLVSFKPIIRVIFWCVTVAGVIVICIYGVEESKRLIKELDEVEVMGIGVRAECYVPGVQSSDRQVGLRPSRQQDHDTDPGVRRLLRREGQQVM